MVVHAEYVNPPLAVLYLPFFTHLLQSLLRLFGQKKEERLSWALSKKPKRLPDVLGSGSGLHLTKACAIKRYQSLKSRRKICYGARLFVGFHAPVNLFLRTLHAVDRMDVRYINPSPAAYAPSFLYTSS